MAESNLNKDLVISDEHTLLSTHRCDLVLECTWEIGALINVLRETVPLTDSEVFHVVRGLTGRIDQLNGIIISAVQDEGAKTSLLEFMLSGKRGDVASA